MYEGRVKLCGGYTDCACEKGAFMKAGIVTHYYKSNNYGGNLQAYALCKVLNDMDVATEQISFSRNSATVKKFTVRGILRFGRRLVTKVCNYSIRHALISRQASINDFNQNMIPHTDTVYDKNTIGQCVDNYDVFITGSDQVWHPVAYCPAYGLEFVPSNKVKISYAASLASDMVSEQHQNTLKKCLEDFSGISVREIQAAELLKDIIDRPVEVSLDPTLLLRREDWDVLCSDFTYRKPYMFCYFLGDSKQQRRLAEEYAARNQLKIVTIPYLLGNYRNCDKTFGDERLYDVSPADFIALIRNAQFVFTDSFHAAVFSSIYEKEFVVFDRSIGSSMGSRLASLMELLNLQERFCNTTEKVTMEYIDSLQCINYHKAQNAVEEQRTRSIMYLKRCIFGDEKKSESD